MATQAERLRQLQQFEQVPVAERRRIFQQLERQRGFTRVEEEEIGKISRRVGSEIEAEMIVLARRKRRRRRRAPARRRGRKVLTNAQRLRRNRLARQRRARLTGRPVGRARPRNGRFKGARIAGTGRRRRLRKRRVTRRKRPVNGRFKGRLLKSMIPGTRRRRRARIGRRVMTRAQKNRRNLLARQRRARLTGRPVGRARPRRRRAPARRKRPVNGRFKGRLLKGFIPGTRRRRRARVGRRRVPARRRAPRRLTAKQRVLSQSLPKLRSTLALAKRRTREAIARGETIQPFERRFVADLEREIRKRGRAPARRRAPARTPAERAFRRELMAETRRPIGTVGERIREAAALGEGTARMQEARAREMFPVTTEVPELSPERRRRLEARRLELLRKTAAIREERRKVAELTEELMQ